jgi:hypothetical protein
VKTTKGRADRPRLTAADTVRLEEESIDQQRKRIRGYRTPWGEVSLRHTGGNWVAITAQGIEEREVEEIVEFVAGEGAEGFDLAAEVFDGEGGGREPGCG